MEYNRFLSFYILNRIHISIKRGTFMLVSLTEAQVMDYILKKLQYRKFLEKLTNNCDDSLKWVVNYKNHFIQGDFVELDSGILVQKNYLGPFEYEQTKYYESHLPTFSQAWSLFCEKYFTEHSIGAFKDLDDLSILYEMLINTVKEMDLQTKDSIIRPTMKNVTLVEHNYKVDFIYLENCGIDILSLTSRKGEL